MIIRLKLMMIGNFRTRTPKGDGNSVAKGIIVRYFKFQNTNPERGRKLSLLWISWSFSKSIISEHEPRKGTETFARLFGSPALFAISEHEPRKGTETTYESTTTNKTTILGFQNTNPERGRKPSQPPAPPPVCSLFQNTNPERGRKLDPLLSHLPQHGIPFQNTNPERGRKQ